MRITISGTLSGLALLMALLIPALSFAHGGNHHHSGEAVEATAYAPDDDHLTPEERLSALETHLVELADAAESGSDGSQPLEDRLRALEENQAEIYHTLAEKKSAGLSSNITDRISISGLIEVEGAAEKIGYEDGSTESGSDMTLATAQLGFGVKLTEEVSGNFSLLHEEDATDLEVDEAAIDVNYAPFFARFGRLYVPFGVFNSHFISDPLTLELGETRETAALLGYGENLFSISTFVFNGNAEKIGEEDHIRDWGASLVLTPMEGLEFGGSYLSDIADTDAELAAEYRQRVGGWSAFAIVEHGAFGVSAEVLGAVKAFDPVDLDADADGQGDKPLAWNLEVSWTPTEKMELAARYEGSDEFAGQPERQYGADISWNLVDHATLSLEYLRGRFDRNFAGDLVNSDGSSADKRDLVTVQLAFEF